MEFLALGSHEGKGKEIENPNLDPGHENESQIQQKPNPDLQNGYRIGDKWRKLAKSKNLTGIPLEEIDTYYKNRTFVVIGSKTGIINRFSKDSGNCLDISHPVRKTSFRIITHWLFLAILAKIILSNCIASALNLKSTYFSLQTVSIFVLLVELTLKYIARGFFHGEFSYIRMRWNLLDLIIIFFGIISIGGNPTSFNWLTILMTFKLIPLVPGMLQAYNSLRETFKKMFDFAFFSIFPILFFALIGLQIYKGILTNKCIADAPDLDRYNESTREAFDDHARDSGNWYMSQTEDGYGFGLCGTEIGCPENYTCLDGYGKNPNFDYTSFDTYFWAIISVVRIVTQDLFPKIYLQILGTAGRWHFVYFAAIFFFGTFTLGSFAYAIIAKDVLNSLDEECEDEETEEAECQEDEIASAKTKSTLKRTRSERRESALVRKSRAILANQYFQYFVTAVIILDVFYLFTHHHAAPDLHFHFSLGITGFAIVVYATEFILKLIAERAVAYFVKFWNCFDCFILILAFIYYCLYGSAFISEEEMTVNVSFYAIRALKLAPRWSSLGFLCTIIFQSLKSFAGLFGILLLFFFDVSLLGFILFSAIYEDRWEEIPRWNFHVFWNSFASSAQILGGSWIEFLWDFFRFGGGLYTSIGFCALVMFLGNFIVMTIALKVILVTRQGLKENSATVPAEAEPRENSNSKTTFGVICLPSAWFSKKCSGCCKIPMHGTKAYKVGEAIAAGAGASNPTAETPEAPARRRRERRDFGIRTKIRKLLEHSAVLGCSILVIIMASVVLGMTDVSGMYYFDIFFTAYFVVEIILRQIGFGIKTCFKDNAFLFDFVIIAEMLINFTQYNDFFTTLNCWTGSCGYFYLRNLRPLMLISRIGRLEVIARGIYEELCQSSSYILAAIYIWLVFAIIGVQNWSGKFYRCTQEDGEIAGYISDKVECEMRNLSWGLPDHYFNDISNGFMSLTLAASLNAWVVIAQDAIDSTSVGLQPMMNNNPWAILYFLAFYIFGVFFLINIFLGILTHQFPKEKPYTIFRTTDQIQKYEANISGKTKKPVAILKPKNPVFQEIFSFVTNPNFDLGIIILIFVDCAAYACEKYEPEMFSVNERERLLFYIHNIILFLYVVEFILKILAWRQNYFKRIVNILDFIVIVTSIIGIMLSDLMAKYFVSPSLLRILRSVRFLQIFKNQSIPQFLHRSRILCLFQAFRLALPVLLNFILFYILFVFSFAMLATELFGNYHNSSLQSGKENFWNFGSSFTTLVEISTFSGWVGILNSLESEEVDCDPDEGSCTSARAHTEGIIFIFVFLTISFFIVANMYLMLIIEIINQLKISEENGGQFSTNEPEELGQEEPEPEVQINDIEMGERKTDGDTIPNTTDEQVQQLEIIAEEEHVNANVSDIAPVTE